MKLSKNPSIRLLHRSDEMHGQICQFDEGHFTFFKCFINIVTIWVTKHFFKKWSKHQYKKLTILLIYCLEQLSLWFGRLDHPRTRRINTLLLLWVGLACNLGTWVLLFIYVFNLVNKVLSFIYVFNLGNYCEVLKKLTNRVGT